MLSLAIMDDTAAAPLIPSAPGEVLESFRKLYGLLYLCDVAQDELPGDVLGGIHLYVHPQPGAL